MIPLAGKWAGVLFAFGLLNASLFAASILPLSTAHVICEGLGFEAGLDRKFKEAPTFYSLYTLLIVVGAGIILIPKAPLLEDSGLLAGGQRRLAARRADFHSAADQPPRPDGRPRQYAGASTSIAWGTSIIMIILTLCWCTPRSSSHPPPA